MANSEAGTPAKSDKVSSSMQQEKAKVHPHPEWAAVQAYYCPGVSMPPSYLSSALLPGHAPPPYIWGPQPMVPPFGSPYHAIYPHGGVYAQPSFPIGSHSHGQGILTPSTGEAVVVTPLRREASVKSIPNKDRHVMKKLKGNGGLAVTIGNGNNEVAVGNAARGTAQSYCNEGTTEGSSDRSDGNYAPGGTQAQRERSSEEKPATGTACSVGAAPGMDFRGSIAEQTKTTAATAPPLSGAVLRGCDGVPPELLIQNERELKRERRKQSNRESARRSRLRKQAESEELALKVEALRAENDALKSDIICLKENSDKLRQENSALMEKLNKAETTERRISPEKIGTEEVSSMGIENLLSRIDYSSSAGRSGQEEIETHENSGGKLHQLMESSPRTDAVTAS